MNTLDPLKCGHSGPRISLIREQLRAAGVDCANCLDPEFFDDELDAAVRSFQQLRGLVSDGRIGPETALALDNARWQLGDRILRFVPGQPMTGDDVLDLQERLEDLGVFRGRIDSVFGSMTDAAIREFQQSVGLISDGTCGPDTLRAFVQLRRSVNGGDPRGLRDRAIVTARGVRLAGRVVVIDPAHGGSANGHPLAVEGELYEADVLLDLAKRLEGRLAAAGVTAVLTRGAGQNPSDAERAQLARDVGADIVLTLHCDRSPSAAANGVATYYWGGMFKSKPSRVGEELASLVQREVVARTGMRNCRTHPRTEALLRLTPMPAIRLELGYASNPDDAYQLADSTFRDQVAEAILVGIQRLFLPEDFAVLTGALSLAELEAQLEREFEDAD